MLTLLAAPALLVLTLFCGGIVIVAQLLGIPDGPGTIYEKAPRWWAKGMLFVSGTTVVIHGDERMRTGEPRIFVSNHVSWYDVLVLVAYLPRYSFVAKAEIFRVPLFGGAARAVGTIPIERENRKSAFQSYEEAAARMKGGRNVVVFPEGTRGPAYALRPFKKGPFVLAIAAGAPIVPTLIHGTIEVLPRNSLWLRPGRVDVHLLEPVPTAGLTYDARDTLAREVYDRLAAAQEQLYDVTSPALPAGAGAVPAAGAIPAV
ncbi:MAG: lysophospholipid acyltransferase family protein [Gemmatirosa sp.]